MRFRTLVVAPALLFAAAAFPSLGSGPRTIAFQGILTRPGGAPEPNGTYTVSFTLYDAATGGAAVWTDPARSVTVTGGRGLFNTTLGSPIALDSVAFDKPYWLEVAVNGDPAPMRPRLPLSAAPYALALLLPYSASESLPGNTALHVHNSGSGPFSVGITGSSQSGTGVVGSSGDDIGVYGISRSGTWAGVEGQNDSGGVGVYGEAAGGVGVAGESTNSTGVSGVSASGQGVYGSSSLEDGVFGVSGSASGVYGSCGPGTGVTGVSVQGNGVSGTSGSGTGVTGVSVSGSGVSGTSSKADGVTGMSSAFDGVGGVSTSAVHAGVAGANTNKTGTGFGVYAESDSPSGSALYATGGHWAGFFNGNVRITGQLNPSGGDVAERFPVVGNAAPGTVVAIDTAHPGALRVASGAYNRTVAGVVSGANALSPGIVLAGAPAGSTERPVAMTGRVGVRCDAGPGAIRPGDLLTTAKRPGYAMRVLDYRRAMGATIGKAMTGLKRGRGLVLALISLQ
jgi:hypothetical protein